MNQLVQLAPELVLVVVACALFLLGVVDRASARRAAPVVALLTLLGLFVYTIVQFTTVPTSRHSAPTPAVASSAAHRPTIQNPKSKIQNIEVPDNESVLRIQSFSIYIKLITSGVGVLLVLLAWPTNATATGNSALNFGKESGEFFALMLLSLCGVFLVASANDIMLLFLGIELASIPTYIMVSISRPLPVAQEAGVKYFFLGAMAAALMLFGFSYLYGVTGETNLMKIADVLHPTPDATATLSAWPMMAVIVLLVGFAFKIAAVPMHVYAGDVYQGAATPVTAFLSFVPKTSGFVAILKVLAALGGSQWVFPPQIATLLWILAALTMTFGNVLGLLQYNIKRLLAYSSIAHSGYMLVGVAAITAALPGKSNLAAVDLHAQGITKAVSGILFYLAAYGLMNAAAFGVLMLLPARQPRPWQSRFAPVRTSEAPTTSSAETFEDIAGQGRRHVSLALAMTIACLSLIGIPLTVGFMGKFLLIIPSFTNGLYALTIIMVINAAISAAYYLKIVGTLFLRTDESAVATDMPIERGSRLPIGAAVVLSVLGSLAFGTFLPATSALQTSAQQAATDMTSPPLSPTPPRTAMNR